MADPGCILRNKEDNFYLADKGAGRSLPLLPPLQLTFLHQVVVLQEITKARSWTQFHDITDSDTFVYLRNERSRLEFRYWSPDDLLL